MPAQFRMYIVRHGETEWNKTRRIQGQLDVPLNETGSRQALLVAKALKDITFARAFSSDLQRASETAECILQYHPNTVLELDKAIRERYMGELQGEFGRSGRPAPSLESTANFVARCLAWYSSVMDCMISMLATDLPMEEPHNILVVTHGAWIATLLSVLQGNGLVTCREGVEIGHCLNTGVSIVEYAETPTSTRRDKILVGTLVQYSGVEHLVHEKLHLQRANVDVLEDKERNIRPQMIS